MPKRTAVTVVKIKNFRTGISEICAQRLITSAVEQPMISSPPMISPQRMLLSSMKELSTSEKDRRGGRCGSLLLMKDACSVAGAGFRCRTVTDAGFTGGTATEFLPLSADPAA